MSAAIESQPQPAFLRQRIWVEGGLLVGGVLLMAGLLGWGVVEFSRARGLRCYPLDPVRSMSAQLTMQGPGLMCMSNRCRMVMRYLPQHGLACYFSAYDRSGRLFTVSGVTPSASQKSFARPGYRTR